MKKLLPLCAFLPLLAACGSDEETTVIEKQPVVVQQPAPAPVGAPTVVEKHYYHQ